MVTKRDEGPFEGLAASATAIATIRAALAELGQGRRWLIPWIAEDLEDRSIAFKILKFATGPTSGCTSGRACARLYLALQGHKFDLSDTNTAFDLTRHHWWLQAMFEFSTGRWRGTREGEMAILAAHPEILRSCG